MAGAAEHAIWRARSEHQNFLLLMRGMMHILSRGGESFMPVFDGKYEYHRASGFTAPYFALLESLTIKDYSELAAPFVANMERVRSVSEFPFQLIYWTAKLIAVALTSRIRNGVDIEDMSRDLDADLQKTSHELWGKINSGTHHPIRDAEFTLSGMLGDGPVGGPIKPACEAAEATLAAMTMGAYATLETLAADLWIVAVNRHPSLASNWCDKNPDKNLPLSAISGYGFNPSASMGKVLHETKRVSFESLYDIKRAYSHAFKGALDDAFEPLDNLVKAEKTRHLFAHRGGLIDRKFKDEVSKFPEYADAVIGDRLRLTGPVVRNHIEACVNCGVALLRSAENWSLANA